MSDESVNGYEGNQALSTGKEQILFRDENGEWDSKDKPDDERPNTWKDSHKIKNSPDEAVQLLRECETGTYYTVCGSTVKYRGKGNGEYRQYLCLKAGHDCNQCPHTERLHQWRLDRGAA